MRIILEADTRLRVTAEGAGLEVDAADDAGVDFSPLHMLAASLATCTVAVLVTWAMQAELSLDGLEIVTDWTYVDDPYRVGSYDMRVRWPGLPDDRRTAAIRVAEHCTVEHTLTHPPTIRIGIEAHGS